MTNQEFEQLQDLIQYRMLELSRLQAKHRGLVGKDFVISGPRNEPGSDECGWCGDPGCNNCHGDIQPEL